MQLAAAGSIGLTKYIFKEIQNFGKVYRRIYRYVSEIVFNMFNGSALIRARRCKTKFPTVYPTIYLPK